MQLSFKYDFIQIDFETIQLNKNFNDAPKCNYDSMWFML